jgi:hypothetical protein
MYIYSGTEFLQAPFFSIIVDGVVLFNCATPHMGLQCLLMGFYVLNRHYPAECGATLEFFQRQEQIESAFVIIVSIIFFPQSRLANQSQ